MSIDSVYKTENGGESISASADFLDEGEELVLERNTVIGNKQLTFSCTFDLFGGVIAGHGKNEYSAAYLQIDSTRIRVFASYAETSIVKDVEHGLQIGSYLNLIVNVGYGTADITVSTKGGTYELKNVPWAGRNGAVFSKAVTGRLDNAVLRWSCGDYKKRIYAFGDSYFNPLSPERWTSYMIKDGYKNALLCGYPGMDTMTALNEFKQAIGHGTPKYAFWCMGMNNPDDLGSVNHAWKTATDEFLIICKEKAIIPVLSTIPEVPGRINNFKNKYVVSSGCRYVDFEKAVAPKGSEKWYDGMLSADLIHPAVPGAKALYIQAMTDFPEMFFN